ncbi:trypsin-like peptidase domain-containing protein [Rhizobium leguminosarum]|uniref:trypsin-like peptidase domain-containing protein n=1 Tax=Rhizobium leguminosarum TaxID=384 RepID=UPI003F969DE0
MDKLAAIFSKIPWTSFGRQTPISRLAKSILPVGNHFGVQKNQSGEIISSHDPGFEDWIMDIQGTAFQCGPGKLLTCWHVCEALEVKAGNAYIHADTIFNGLPTKTYYPVSSCFNFIDPRHQKGNASVDVGVLICPVRSSDSHKYQVPAVKWGDSTQVGIGDRVLIGGYPLGRDLFLTATTNRGIVQPTFYDGIISAILPATKPEETRLFQISSVALGGISGGVVCTADTGRVIGMVTSGLSVESVSLPITYAIPSEVLHPWVDAISFVTRDGKWE